jgi:AraC-like DNA-binding protein
VSVIGRLDLLGAWGRLGPAILSKEAANVVAPSRLEALFSAVDQLLTIEDADAIVLRAIELARDQIGLVRVSIYVADGCRHLMLGTWGSDSTGAIVDEHHVMYAMSGPDREAFAPDEAGAPYAVVEDRVVVEHQSRRRKIAHRGWITCTPIRCGQEVIGMAFNDAGPSHADFDETKQAEMTMLCSVLGPALASLARAKTKDVASERLPVHRLVMASVAMIAQDPGVGVDQIARRLAVSRQRVARLFEATLGVSLPEYRNRARLDRVAFLIAKGGTSLPEAAVAAGFKSHAQFQQVSRTFRWMALLKRLSQ